MTQEPRCKHDKAPTVTIERQPSEHYSEEYGGTMRYSHEWRCHCPECGAFIDQGAMNAPEVIAAEYQVSGRAA